MGIVNIEQDKAEVAEALKEAHGKNGNGMLSNNGYLEIKEQEDAPSCPDCGLIMIRSGTCYKCLNCGTTSGCS